MLRGMSHSSRDQLLVVDLTPYDASVPLACLELNAAATATHPTLACVSALWTGRADENKFINKEFNIARIRFYFNSFSEMLIPTSLWEQTKHEDL